MSFASNWLEELVAEWLELEGYLVIMRPPVHLPGSHGGRFEPDVVGARIREGILQIRHCETTVAFAGNPDYEEQRVNKKFQQPLKQRIYELFCIQFGIQKNPAYDYALSYETWVIYSYASRPVKARLGAIPGLTLKRTDDLIAEEVIESLAKWGEERQTDQGTQPTMPQDKWLLQMLDYLVARSDYRWGMRGRVEKFSPAKAI